MLQDIQVRRIEPKDKPYKLADERGLYLLITPAGGKLWRFDYRHEGKRKTLAIGAYPDVPLADARTRREEARKLLAAGIDPMAKRKSEKEAPAHTLEAVAREFMVNNAPRWSECHHRHVTECFERDVFPWLGAKAVGEVTAPELLKVLNRIKDRGALETAHRTKQFIGQAIRFAVATGRAERDPTADLKGALPSPVRRHFHTITEPKRLAELLRTLDAYQGSFTVRTALRLLPLVFARPGNLAKMEWSEVDLDAAEWRIPAGKMKMRDRHIVPLASQAVELLRDIHPLSGSGRYVFPADRRRLNESMSRETLGATLRRLGFKGEMTAHGFRATASTILHEQGFHSEMIERQLAHAERNAVKAAYCHAEYLPERRRMMQAWADYLNSLKAGAAVIPFRKAGV
jgi:integrase